VPPSQAPTEGKASKNNASKEVTTSTMPPLSNLAQLNNGRPTLGFHIEDYATRDEGKSRLLDNPPRRKRCPQALMAPTMHVGHGLCLEHHDHHSCLGSYPAKTKKKLYLNNQVLVYLQTFFHFNISNNPKQR
jgi:hypothetical protein